MYIFQIPVVVTLNPLAHFITSSNMSNTLADPCALTVNPDITGIGVRVAIYVQSLIAIIVVADRELWISLAQGGLLTNICLVLATIIQWKTLGNVSLIDGIIVTLLSNLGTIAAMPAALYDYGKMTAYTFHIAALLIGTLNCVWTIVVQAEAPTFGQVSGCHTNDHVVFAIVGIHVRATVLWLRVVLIVASAVTIIKAPIEYVKYLNKAQSEPDDSSSTNSTGRCTAVLTTPLTLTYWSLALVTIELTLEKNGVRSQTAQWTLGQTMSMLLVVQPIVEIVRKAYRMSQ
ncbi:hypothetical protein JAAARDRAFT_414063 [Jaapia argillacea MUCL 33604]|uniref:Uncharacterized protein n=1 Tax=Jaapia argillacea MUCL 33604 TaxID=933084 RepID=A0A067PFY8_9AGAM|nr:hypothetical protein JAAARDRAFT_414063 [Jaapia argillacea MUCL 33604]